MREIKFRAWDKESKCWATGPQPQNDDVFIEDDTDQSGQDHIYTITHWERTIISQFTGLKDKNGKDIYEGDILDSGTVAKNGMRFLYVIVWGHHGWHVKSIHQKRPPTQTCNYYFKMPIVGNIYENPDLLKV